jgi:single-stranded-DNA-specific exonuclease
LGATGVTLSEPPKLMGPKEQHFSGRFRHHNSTIRGIAFGQAEWVAELTAYQGPIDIAFRPMLNEFQGMRRVELQIVDWRKSEAGVPDPHLNGKMKTTSVLA